MKKKFRSNKYWWAACREKIIILSFLACFFFITPTKTQPTAQASLPSIRATPNEPLPVPKPAPYPVNTTGVQAPANLTAHAVLVLDADSGVTLFSKNEQERMAPASTTKLMTAMVALDLYGSEDVVTVQEATLSGQIMDLVVGEKISVENLLYGLLISSANDASYILAQHHKDGPAGFMAAMNKKAQAIGLEQTFYVNPAGFDDDLHKMTAKDVAVMARVAMTYPLIAKIVSIPQITVHDTSYTIFHPLRTTNVLLGKIPGVAGIKTGYTQQAGENLVSLTERNGKKIIIVALRSLDRFGDTESLINWAFSNHQWVEYGL